MEIAKISKQGFWSTAILVVVLWSLVGANLLIVHRAETESSQALRKLRYLRFQKGSGRGESPEKQVDGAHTSTPRAQSISI